MSQLSSESNARPALVLHTSAASAEAGNDADAALVERARRGDLEAWSSLYRNAYAPTLRHVCFLTGDAPLAEDLVQDAFARAFAAIDTFDGRAGFTTWVRGIALNVVRMHWRRSKTTQRVHGALERMSSVAAEADRQDPHRRHQQEQRMKMVYRVLDELPDHLREAFVLRELEGVSVQDAAAELGISPGNVAVRATRARAKIRDELTRRGWMGGGA